MTDELKRLPGMSDKDWEAMQKSYAFIQSLKGDKAAKEEKKPEETKSPEDAVADVQQKLDDGLKTRARDRFNDLVEARKRYDENLHSVVQLEDKLGVTAIRNDDKLTAEQKQTKLDVIRKSNSEWDNSLNKLGQSMHVMKDRLNRLNQSLEEAHQRGVDVSDVEKDIWQFDQDDKFTLQSVPSLQMTSTQGGQEGFMHSFAAAVGRLMKGVARALGFGRKGQEQEQQAKAPANGNPGIER